MKLKEGKVYKVRHYLKDGTQVQWMFRVVKEEEDCYLIDKGNGSGTEELVKSETENMQIELAMQGERTTNIQGNDH